MLREYIQKLVNTMKDGGFQAQLPEERDLQTARDIAARKYYDRRRELRLMGKKVEALLDYRGGNDKQAELERVGLY